MFKRTRANSKSYRGSGCGIFSRLKLAISSIFAMLFLFVSGSLFAETIDIPKFTQGSLGKHTEYFREQDNKLSLEAALKVFASNKLLHGTSNSISLGIDVAPVWMKFTINNRSPLAQHYRLSVETPWIDYIDTWLIQDGKMVKHIAGGDGYPFESRPMQYRFYAFEHEYLTGQTEVIMRVETKGPMALPVQFSSVEQAIHRDIASGYQYGALYGIMLALALYNLVLFGFIRQREYGLYGLYLLGFVLNSLSYTGQLHTIITYDFGAYFQDWLDIFLMITYSVAGLHFARALLHTKDYAPKLDRFVLRTTLYIPLGMFVGFVFNHLFFSMILAFILNTCFVMLFIAMGVKALQAQKPFAVIFVLSSVTAAVCITISTLAVAGVLVPYNDYTFKAIEVGMAFEAILLASILARQFRMAQIDKLIAEKYARTDPLTELNNRRGFKELTESKWQDIIEDQHNVSIALIDIDYFKQVNDTYGHNIGDEVLKLVAKAIADSCREGDIAARWGGEEFIVFLPNTSRDGAIMQAEHIRETVENISFSTLNSELLLTASIGVAGTVAGKFELSPTYQDTIESLVKSADRALYIAKHDGKNQVKIVS
ncbi:sensor domain-containing diguanylate cyclase [Shewanella sp. TC10]|uniref:sensor domain-containing diguanylate cyclase n=1 Tax=Shewanella sp. TC10 TaxID=1419739 RepID=UPI00129DC387|nr:diguanylate cyclase [Shewanella sp. TC10]